MYHATEVIAKTFSEKGLKYRTREAGKLSMVEAGFDGKIVKNVIIRFLSALPRSPAILRISARWDTSAATSSIKSTVS